MKTTLAFLTLFIIIFKIPLGLYGQDQIEDNDLQFISGINEQIDTINLETTVVFLNYLNIKSNNVEFLELRNETLYKLLERRSEMYLLGMCQLNDTIQWITILNEIESAVSDRYVLETISLSANGVLIDECQLNVLQKTIISLEKAILKYNK